MALCSHDDTFDSTGFSDDDQDKDDDRNSDDDGQDSGSDDHQNDEDASGDDQSDDDGGDGASAIAGASDHEVEAHRNMLGDVLTKLSDNGIDVDELAEKAGVDSSDVDALTHDDLASLTQYVTQHHPEVVDRISDRYPAAHGILSFFTGR